MNLKNYTSSVAVVNSIGKIEHNLAQAGATHIAKSYDEGKPTGMIFQIPVNGIPMTFKLPAKEDKVYEYMIKQKKYGYKNDVKETTKRQSSMTAWKILSDWIELQVSMIMIEHIDTIEAFLPYLYDHKSDKTFFEIAKGNGFKQLTEGVK